MSFNLLIYIVIFALILVYLKLGKCRWNNRISRAVMLFLLLCWLTTKFASSENFYIAPEIYLLKYPVLIMFLYSESDFLIRLWQQITLGESSEESAKELSRCKEIPIWIAKIMIFELTVIKKLMFWKNN